MSNDTQKIEELSIPSRLNDIDRAKGLAIILVVFGHIVSRESPADNSWYDFAKSAVYSFHMGFFMFLSGIVFFIKIRPAPSIYSYVKTVKTRFNRLMPAYFLFAFIVFFGKLIAQQIMHVDNPVRGAEDLLNIALFPMLSISSFLWYIYALFMISILALGIFSLSGGSMATLIILGGLFILIPNVNFLAAGQITKFFLFFVLGGVAIKYWQTYTKIIDKIWVYTLILMIFLIGSNNFKGSNWIYMTGLALPTLHGLCRKITYGSKILEKIGEMTFPIYLINTIAIGVTKGIMLKITNWNGTNFIIFFPVLFLAGIWIPILIKKYFISRYYWLNKILS